jgi:hypothetical protein
VENTGSKKVEAEEQSDALYEVSEEEKLAVKRRYAAS